MLSPGKEREAHDVRVQPHRLSDRRQNDRWRMEDSLPVRAIINHRAVSLHAVGQFSPAEVIEATKKGADTEESEAGAPHAAGQGDPSLTRPRTVRLADDEELVERHCAGLCRAGRRRAGLGGIGRVRCELGWGWRGPNCVRGRC